MEKFTLSETVFPSNVQTVSTVKSKTTEEYATGAHEYHIKECLGFNNGETQYTDSEQVVRFVMKLDDGTMKPGLQSEQLVIALLDRHKKLNNRFPSPQNEKMIAGLQMFLDACKERVEDRLKRGVMGDLKK